MQTITCIAYAILVWTFSHDEVSAQQQKEETSASELTPAQAEALRSRFLAEVQRLSNNADQKERWIREYTNLENNINKASMFIQSQEAKLARESDGRIRLAQQQLMNQTNSLITSNRLLQHYSTISYSQLLKREQLDNSLKNGSLPKPEYLENARALEKQMAETEQLRQMEYFSYEMREALDTISGELSKIGRTVDYLSAKTR
jgi:hypothetical protein